MLNKIAMCQHEEKKCPRCHQLFECKAGSINNCQCKGITLNAEERSFIDTRYQDCLCRNCLLELKQGFVLFREKYFFNAHK